MATESLLEPCPTCRTGNLTGLEERLDGFAKSFSCGHKHFSIQFEERLEFHASLGFKVKRRDKGKPYLEGRSGDGLHFKTGKWMIVERIIDRAKNWYKELVTDPKTGNVVHHCEEPLSQHQGHGTARTKE